MYLTEPITPPDSVARVARRRLAELSCYADHGLVSVEAESDRPADVHTEVSIRLDPAFAADEHNWELVYATTNDVLREPDVANQVPFLMTTSPPQRQGTRRTRGKGTTL